MLRVAVQLMYTLPFKHRIVVSQELIYANAEIQKKQ